MNARLAILSALFIVFLATLGCEREDDKALATINNEKIRVADFKKRYKKFLEISSTKDNLLTRKRILEHMINEKLILQDVIRQGLDDDKESQRRMEEIRLQALMDRYAKKVSADTIIVSEQELWDAFRAYNSKVNARFLYAKTKEEAALLKRHLEEGATFESLAKEIFEDPGLANNGGNLGYFGWGEMESALEDVAFTLPIGQLSDPVHLRMGYAIVKVEDRVPNPLVSELDYAKVKGQLEHTVFHKKIQQTLTNMLDNIVDELSPQFNETAVQLVVRQWHSLTAPKPGSRREEQTQWENFESMPLVNFQKTSWTVKTFMEMVGKTTERQRHRVRSEQDVKDMCTGLAARQILLDRARKVVSEHDAAVTEQISAVRQDYLMKRWMRSVQDTAGKNGWDETHLRTHFERHRRQYQVPPMVNVAEILVRTEREAQELMRQLKRGGSFADLARKHSIRLWAAKRGGELGFGTEADFSIVGKKFFSANVGQLLGPERVDPYYGVFTILAKRDGRFKTFEEAKEEIIHELGSVRQQEVLATAIGELRKRSAVTVNEDLLTHMTLE